ncbi:gluconokinase [Granulosicoccaceae sp. 1_MG-2023]|nr:gluconokinase [Granulosicoccaceae sp. 1_MG-2023]
MSDFSPARILVVMGVCGCGKSTIGAALSGRLDVPFEDADDYHPAANVEKMSRGIALQDADRWPWLDAIGNALRAQAARHGRVVAACSALRRDYRDRLVAAAGEPVLFIYLNGSRELIAARMAARKDHFMPAQLLDSQFATLEVPEPEENVMVVDIGAPVSDIAETIQARLEAV